MVLDEAHARLGVTQDVGDLFGRTGLIEGHGHAAVRERPEVGQVPLDPVVGEDPDLLARSDSQFGEPGGDFAHGAAVVGPTQRLPTAPHAAAQRGPIGNAAHRGPERVDDGVALDVNRRSVFHGSPYTRSGSRSGSTTRGSSARPEPERPGPAVRHDASRSDRAPAGAGRRGPSRRAPTTSRWSSSALASALGRRRPGRTGRSACSEAPERPAERGQPARADRRPAPSPKGSPRTWPAKARVGRRRSGRAAPPHLLVGRARRPTRRSSARWRPGRRR